MHKLHYGALLKIYDNSSNYFWFSFSPNQIRQQQKLFHTKGFHKFWKSD